MKRESAARDGFSTLDREQMSRVRWVQRIQHLGQQGEKHTARWAVSKLMTV